MILKNVYKLSREKVVFINAIKYDNINRNWWSMIQINTNAICVLCTTLQKTLPKNERSLENLIWRIHIVCFSREINFKSLVTGSSKLWLYHFLWYTLKSWGFKQPKAVKCRQSDVLQSLVSNKSGQSKISNIFYYTSRLPYTSIELKLHNYIENNKNIKKLDNYHL